MTKLNVELYGSLIGTLTGGQGKLFDFTVNPEVFERYPLFSNIMSISVPLNLRYTPLQRKSADNFFTGLLPEGNNLKWLMQTLPKPECNTFGLLRRYGKDLPGALVICDPESSAAKPRADIADSKEIKRLLEHMQQEPLANAPNTGSSSIGGSSDKIVLAKINSFWHRVHNGYPSTHILIPATKECPTLIYDKAFCMQLAQKCGLTAHSTQIKTFDSIDALVIDRFDRDEEDPADSVYGRVHLETFAQALAISGAERYQANGGKVSAKIIAGILAKYGREKDVTAFAQQLIFAVAIGNLDMHAGNISIMHFPDETIALAPAYDMVPMRHLSQAADNAGKAIPAKTEMAKAISAKAEMALSVNGKFGHPQITRDDIAQELLSWNTSAFTELTVAVNFIDNTLLSIKEALENTMPHKNAYPQLIPQLKSFITNLLTGKPAE